MGKGSSPGKRYLYRSNKVIVKAKDMSSSQKKAICLYFEVHQPFRLRRYRFFEMGHEHYYYDDYMNESIMRKIAEHCYLPANKIMLDLIQKHKGKFKITFSLTGIVIDQFRLYAPEVLESFRELAKTGCVEFLAETNSHSLASLKNRELFMRQVSIHRDKMSEYLGVEPQSIRNTELIYSDEIGNWMADLGFKATVTEGAKHILGWKSPNYLYCNALNPRLKVLLRNYSLSDDIAFRFSNQGWSDYPLTADKYALWLKEAAPTADIINIFMDYETFGEHQKKETGIFDFLKHLPDSILKKTPFTFMTVSEIADKFQPVSVLHVPSPISWADEERDLTAWMGNDLQNAAVEKLYSLAERVSRSGSESLLRDWIYLQSSDHFYYMSTKFFSDGDVHAYFNPYENPYQAFLNYMNILSDFELRLDKISNLSTPDLTIQNLTASVGAKDEIISKLEEKVVKLEKKIETSRKLEKSPGGTLVKAAKKVADSLAVEKVKAKTPAVKRVVKPAIKGKAKAKMVTGESTKTPVVKKTAAAKKTTVAKKTTTVKKPVAKKK
jgi:alpha-amylase